MSTLTLTHQVKLYKLTNHDLTTFGGYVWAPGEWHDVPGEGEICTAGWLHAYEHPLLAILHSPLHTRYTRPRLWEATGEGRVLRDGQMKLGVQRLRLDVEIDMPAVSTEQRVAYAIYCAWEVADSRWHNWAAGWLAGKDKSPEAAEAAEASAWAQAAARAAKAAEAAEAAEAWAAWAAKAAAGAARAARAARAAGAARAAAEAAEAWAAAAAKAAAEAAEAAKAAGAAKASREKPGIDLLYCALRACTHTDVWPIPG